MSAIDDAKKKLAASQGAPGSGANGASTADSNVEPQVFLGYHQSIGRQVGDLNATGSMQDNIQSLTAAQNSWYAMSDEDAKNWAEKAFRLGYINNPKDMLSAQQVWNTMCEQAGGAYTIGHKNVTPSDMLDYYAGHNVDVLKQRTAAGKDGLTVTRQVNLADKSTVQALANQVLQQALGRDATDAEVNTFFNTIRGEQKANPDTTTTTSHQGKDGKNVVTSSHEPGFGQDDINQLLLSKAQNDPEYASYQGATTYFQAALQALQPIGGTGA